MDLYRDGADAPLIIYLHVPKTAGSSLMTILEREYGDGFYRLPDNRNLVDVNDVAASIPSDIKGRVRLVTGHIPYGVHKHFPRPAVYAALFRDPVDRVASLYYYIRRMPGHHLHELAVNTSLLEFATSSAVSELDNGQVRWASGRDDVGMRPVGTHVDESDLERALLNIDGSFAAVGLSNRFDDALVTMRSRLHWSRTIEYRRVNVTAQRPAVPLQVAEVIRESNRYDNALVEEIWRRSRSASWGSKLLWLLPGRVVAEVRAGARALPMARMKQVAALTSVCGRVRDG